MPQLAYDDNGCLLPPIGLQTDNDDDKKDKVETTRFEWSDLVGNKIKKDVPVFRKGTVEQLLKWREAVENILTEQAVSGVNATISTYNRVLANPAKNHYNNGIQQACNKEDRCVQKAMATGQAANINYSGTHLAGLQAIAQIIFPDDAYIAQRTWLQLTVQKPFDMTIRAFVFRIEEINGHLPAFPTSDGQVAQALTEMELTELLWRSIPRKWQIELQRNKVKRHAITRTQFIAEIETIQAVELQKRALEHKGKKGQNAKHKLSYRAKDLQAGASQNEKTIKHKKSHKKLRKERFKSDGLYFCLRHGENPSHPTDKCKVLMAEAQKLKRQHEAGSKESRTKFKSSYHGLNEKDLNALIDQRINKRSKKTKLSSNKKTKFNEDLSSSSDNN